MTMTGSPAVPDGVLWLTWVRDRLAHVLEHCNTDEPSGTWTGLACADHGLALGADVDAAAMRQLSARGQLADLIWEAPAGWPLSTASCSGPRSRPITRARPRRPGSCGTRPGPCGPGPGRRTSPRSS